TVSVVGELNQPVSVRIWVDGIVTVDRCEPGTEISSGDTTWSVAGKPLLQLAGPEPFYRDLLVGDIGPDVTALSRELGRLGRLVPDSPAVTAELVDAVWQLLGEPVPDSLVIPLQRLVWLLPETVAVAQCSAGLGARVASGDVVAVTEAELTSVRAEPVPTDL